jgi:hypothetical protein
VSSCSRHCYPLFGIRSSRFDSASIQYLCIFANRISLWNLTAICSITTLNGPFAHRPPSDLSSCQHGSVLGGPLSPHLPFITRSSLTIQVWFFCHAQQTHACCGNIEPISSCHFITLSSFKSGITTIPRGHVLFFFFFSFFLFPFCLLLLF